MSAIQEQAFVLVRSLYAVYSVLPKPYPIPFFLEKLGNGIAHVPQWIQAIG
ncbi:hypothetical protein [Geitlerinema sp. PCC 9228]|jgi:hypothetical protein|uniref:hypothetical protein n=1 Tax=Geitlerinema sp. PCC 9228 TaxID=111611 RepID=UPI001480F6E1|nr:hypothetical protein [Geitlerinema sp. PCC 9228]